MRAAHEPTMLTQETDYTLLLITKLCNMIVHFMSSAQNTLLNFGGDLLCIIHGSTMYIKINTRVKIF